MRNLIAAIGLLASVMLAACAGQPQQLAAAPRLVQAQAFATLATNACEQETAGPYTALAASRYRAAARLRAGAMGVDAARRVQTLADQARAELDAACVKGKPDAVRVGRAKALLGDIRSILEL